MDRAGYQLLSGPALSADEHRGSIACRLPHPFEDLDHPGRFRFFEAWENQAAFDAHRSADYEHDFMSTQIPRAIGASAMEFELSGVKILESEVPADAEGATG